MKKAIFLVAAALSLLVSAKAQNAPNPQSATVTVSSQIVGRTPALIGYNMGDNFPGSNVSNWLRYSEMNGARFWWPQPVWPDDPPRWNGGLAQFEAQRAQLGANPMAGLDWKAYEAKVGQHFKGIPAGTIGSVFSLSELRKMGVEVLVMLSRSTPKHPFNTADGAPDWFGRWTYWRGVYLNAFYLARTYDVQRFQLFNEPDHPAHIHIEQSDYLRRLQIGSDAVQAAINDVNRIDGKSLRAQISAPVSAGMIVFGPRQGRPDTRDAKTGWGELAMRHRRENFSGSSAANPELFQVYAFQSYGRSPARISKDLPKLRQLVAGANGGVALPLIVSEMNVSTAGDFSKKPETLDSAGYYDAFGAIAAAYVNAGIDEVYVFRLTQTDNLGNGQVKKNGTHIIDNRDPLKNITSSTRGAEAVRLFMRGFKGARARMAEPTVTGKDLHTAGARDEANGTSTLMVTNLGAARNVSLDLSAWKLPQGALTTVEEVSATHHGDVRMVLGLPLAGKMTLTMAAHSIALVTVRPTLSGTPRAVVPVAVEQGTLRALKPRAMKGRVMLALQATAHKTPLRVRVYGGTGDVAQADLLGQVVLQPQSAQAMVDVTRYVTAAGQKMVFQIVPDDARLDATAFSIGAAQLRVFEAFWQ